MSHLSNLPAEENLSNPELTITRVFDAPRPLVFEAWTKKEHLDRWCMPRNFALLDTGGDVRPGGVWYSVMQAPDGELYRVGGVYREIVQDELLSFTHKWEEDDGTPEHESLVTVSFVDEADGKTRMTFHQAPFRSVESRDSHRGGWTEIFDNMTEYLARVEQTEVATVH